MTTHPAGHVPETKDAVRDSGRKLRSEGSRLADEMRSIGQSFADQQKDEAVRYVDDLVAAAESGAAHLRKSGRDSSARFVHGTAEQVGGWAQDVRGRGTGELFREVEDFARDRPLLFFGAAFAIGFAAARFIRSNPEQEPEKAPAVPAAAE